MSRVKGGIVTRRKHKKILKLAKGYYGSRHRLYKRASEAVLHSGEYAFAGRKQRRRDLRRLWIARINAALKPHELSYNVFIKILSDKMIGLDRKILADLAVTNKSDFDKIVNKLTSQI